MTYKFFNKKSSGGVVTPVDKSATKNKVISNRQLAEDGYIPTWSEEILVIKKVKNTVRWKYVIDDLIKLLERVMKNNYKKQIK